MKIIAIIGSRNEAGKTAEVAQSLLDAMESKGAITETLFLPGMKIESCRQCNADGWGDCREKGSCIIGDDFESIVEKIRAAGADVFATPVYFGDLSESMKAFTDRLRRCNRSTISQTGKNDFHIPAIGICNAGGGGGGSEQCSTNLKNVLNTCGFEVIDMVPVRRQNMEIKKRTLRELGEWLPDHIQTGEWERVIPRPQKG